MGTILVGPHFSGQSICHSPGGAVGLVPLPRERRPVVLAALGLGGPALCPLQPQVLGR